MCRVQEIDGLIHTALYPTQTHKLLLECHNLRIVRPVLARLKNCFHLKAENRYCNRSESLIIFCTKVRFVLLFIQTQ